MKTVKIIMESVSPKLMTKVQKSILMENELVEISPKTIEKLCRH